ncbi:hypothetical protein E3N88_29096 [Mikania micrantha]|uniref:AP2/ERF domain-containing protein n=1 Tax=Mikania micrantha TaxID=192012 RepID=A0A5N6N471_9ASTR|nr:hypothetical protein E3N88_29096 [Mikania micrantha]
MRSSSSSSAAAADSDSAKYRGVRKRKWGKWVSEIRLPNSRERIWLGSYDSPEKAARAFDAALFCLRGNTANFNFPDQPPNIPGGTDLHPSQIQAAAAHYANSYHPTPSSSSSHVSNNYDMFHVMDDHNNNNDIISHIHPDYYGMFTGFDDYFMQPPADHYGSEDQAVNYDDSQPDPSSFLWNF